jgi:hypothetical protein
MEVDMTTDSVPDALRALWQKQPDTKFSMEPDDIQKKFSRLQARLRRRKYFAYVVCSGESIIFAWWLIFTTPPIVIRIGFLLIILGMNFLGGQIWLDNRERQKALENSGAVGQTNCVDFYRAELVRQRNFHRGLWFWSRMVALLPGLLLMGIWSTIKGVQDGGSGVIVLIATPILAILAVWLNYRLSRKHQRQIDAIDAMKQANGAGGLP